MKCCLFCLMLMLPFCASAQKAYDAVLYKGTLQGKTIQLYLGNGYVAASKITISAPKQKPVLFLPESGIANEKFMLRNTQSQAKDLFTLYHIQESYYKAPGIISGTYQSRKKSVPVKFYLAK